MMRTTFVLATSLLASVGVAQDKRVQQPSAREQLQRIHTPQSIDQQLVRLTKDLELSAQQQKHTGEENRRLPPPPR
jgi:hypothetical protein